MNVKANQPNVENAKPRGKRRRTLPVWKKCFFAGAVFLAFMVISLAGLEILLALLYPSAGFQGRRDGHRYTWGHRVDNNRFGFRERDFQTPKPEGVFRVMVLGDSFTWGVGLASELRYTDRLDKILQEDHPRPRIEVLNFGVSGGPTTRERDVLKEHVNAIQPDLVIVGFCINDPQPKEQRYSSEAEKYQWIFTTLHRSRHLGLHRSSLFLDRCLWDLMEKVGLVPRWQEALQRVYEPDSNQWRQFVRALHDIKSICEERNLPPPIFISLNQGTSATSPTDYGNPNEELATYLRWYHQAEGAAREAGMVVVNVERELARQMSDEPMGVNPLDGHPSPACHEIYARKLAQCVRPLLDSPTVRLAGLPEKTGTPGPRRR